MTAEWPPHGFVQAPAGHCPGMSEGNGATTAARVGEDVREVSEQIARDYGREDRPLGGYLAVMGVYSAAVAGLAAVGRARGIRFPKRISVSDLALLAVAVNVLVRFAPAEPRSERWVSVGSAFVVLSWAVMSEIFRLYVASVASFRSPWGTFVTVLVLTTYVNLSAIVFLVGVEADELIRKDATPGEKGLFERVRSAFG